VAKILLTVLLKSLREFPRYLLRIAAFGPYTEKHQITALE